MANKSINQTGLEALIRKIKAAFFAKTEGVTTSTIGIDDEPTEDSDNLVTSGGVYAAIQQGGGGGGVPTGGTAGQVLAKKTATDYDTEWITPPSGHDFIFDDISVGSGSEQVTLDGKRRYLRLDTDVNKSLLFTANLPTPPVNGVVVSGEMYIILGSRTDVPRTIALGVIDPNNDSICAANAAIELNDYTEYVELSVIAFKKRTQYEGEDWIYTDFIVTNSDVLKYNYPDEA